MATSSSGFSNTRFIGVPMMCDAITSSGATRIAIWIVDPPRDRHHRFHSVLSRKVDRGDVFGGIADDSQHGDAEEERRQAEAHGGLSKLPETSSA